MGRIELSPQTVIGPTSGSGVTFRGRLGKSRRQSDGSRQELWPSCVHTQELSKTNGRTPKTLGLRSGAAESSEDLDGWHFSAGHSLIRAARRRALHPPRRLMPNLTTGAMRNCLASPVSGALFGAIRGWTLLPPRVSDWLVPATTDASVEPHTHHRRLLHAFGLLAPEPHGGEMERIVQDGLSRTLIVDMRSMLSRQTPYSRSSTPDLWAWGNVA